MFKDQFGNNLVLGDAVIYSKSSWKEKNKPTLAIITTICERLDYNGEECSYLSVKPLVARKEWKTQILRWVNEGSRALKKPEKVIKVDRSLYDNLINQEVQPM